MARPPPYPVQELTTATQVTLEIQLDPDAYSLESTLLKPAIQAPKALTVRHINSCFP
jgi:hypothetical protein